MRLYSRLSKRQQTFIELTSASVLAVAMGFCADYLSRGGATPSRSIASTDPAAALGSPPECAFSPEMGALKETILIKEKDLLALVSSASGSACGQTQRGQAALAAVIKMPLKAGCETRAELLAEKLSMNSSFETLQKALGQDPVCAAMLESDDAMDAPTQAEGTPRNLYDEARR